ncbi:MAG: DUF362 domain-containing protein [Acidobacteriota bacterium]
MTRRHWLAAGAASMLPMDLEAARTAKSHFAVHPFIEAHPQAVFLKRTRIASKTDSAGKLRAGLELMREVLLPVEQPGIPVGHRVILKPNFTSVRNKRPDIENWGTGTDSQFYEGVVLGLKELGVRKMHFLEANNFHTWNFRGLVDINERHGIEMNEPERRERNFRDSYEMTWTKVHDPVVYRRIPHFAPVNENDTWLLNIAKWKSHGMCMTLSTKNLQGLVVKPFVRFCPGWSMVTGVPAFMKPDVHAEAEPRIKRYFENHARLGYARYESQADLSPMHQEIWAHKTCDNYQTLNPGLNIIEGLYGRDGDGFGIGVDHLTNLLMFGKDRLTLDLIGMYLGGHEPGNVNLFRIAKERGLMQSFNPWDIEVYEWINGSPVRRKLEQLPRTPLKTYYLQKDGEPRFHLVNERFDYDKIRA